MDCGCLLHMEHMYNPCSTEIQAATVQTKADAIAMHKAVARWTLPGCAKQHPPKQVTNPRSQRLKRKSARHPLAGYPLPRGSQTRHPTMAMIATTAGSSPLASQLEHLQSDVGTIELNPQPLSFSYPLQCRVMHLNPERQLQKVLLPLH